MILFLFLKRQREKYHLFIFSSIKQTLNDVTVDKKDFTEIIIKRVEDYLKGIERQEDGFIESHKMHINILHKHIPI